MRPGTRGDVSISKDADRVLGVNGVLMQPWEDLSGRRVFRLRVWIDRDLCVYAADLPGCVSQGYDSIEECLTNIEEAFRGVVESYDAHGEPIPWVNGGQRPLFHEERSIAVEFAASTGITGADERRGERMTEGTDERNEAAPVDAIVMPRALIQLSSFGQFVRMTTCPERPWYCESGNGIVGGDCGLMRAMDTHEVIGIKLEMNRKAVVIVASDDIDVFVRRA